MNEVTIIFGEIQPFDKQNYPFAPNYRHERVYLHKTKRRLFPLPGDHGIDAGPDFRCRVLPRIGLDDLAVLGIVVRLAVGPQFSHVGLLDDFEQFVRLESHLTIVPSAKYIRSIIASACS